MKGLALLLLLWPAAEALGSPTATAWQLPGSPPTRAPATASYALEGTPTAAIAEAFEVELWVQHGPELHARVQTDNLSPDRGWLLLESPRGLVHTGPEGQRATHFRLRAAPIATGGEVDEELRFQPTPTLAWPELEVEFHGAEGARVGEDSHGRLAVPGFLVAVASVLPPDTSAPPAPLGLSALEAPPEQRPWYTDPRFRYGAVAVVLLGFAIAFARRRRTRASAAPAAVTARQRLELALSQAEGCAAHERRAVTSELTSALRAHVDESLGRDRAGLLEEEWLADLALEPGGGELAKPLGALFAASVSVRWGGAEPSVYTLEEHVQLAKSALAALDAMASAAALHNGERAA